ncbi:MAG: Ig-like domain-containing protein [Planctomycetaceae bacterium]|nr:Ig-like domain-containing protein [Planctomycetaceae bacterium]
MWSSKNRRGNRNARPNSLRLRLRSQFEKLEDRSLLAAFVGGNLLVERIGDGSTALTNAAFQVSLLEYATSGGSAVQTMVLPTSGANQVTDSGTATSNGYLNILNGRVAVPGYNSPAGTAGVATLNTKVATVIGQDGNVASRTLFPTTGTIPFSGNNFRSMIATGSDTFYATGNGSATTGGIWYANAGSFTQISPTVTNARNVEIYNGQLFLSTGSGTPGIYSVGSGLPTTTGQSATAAISTGVGSSPYGFVMFDTDGNGVLDRAYIADDRTGAGGGLQKWTFNGTSWSNSWALLVNGSNALSGTAGSGFAGLRGLSGSFSNGVATLYATTNEASNNRLISIVDTGASTPTSATQLATAGANYVFRGVDVFADNTPPLVTSIEDGDIDNEVAVGDTLTYTITFNEDIDASTVSAADFDNSGTAGITVGSVTAVSPKVFSLAVTPTTTGSIVLRIPTGAVIKDLAGNSLVVPVLDDTTITVIEGADTTPPSVVSIVDNDPDNLVALNQTVTYTISFSEDIDAATVGASDFDNAGSSTITVGAITETSPGVFTVQVTPTSGNSLRLRIIGTIKDVAGNDLVVPVLDDDTLTVDAVAPTVTNITNNSTGTLFAESAVTYTITFSEAIDVSTLSISDFSNAGTATVVLGAITQVSPSVYTLVVTPTSGGTLRLQLPVGAVVKDIAGNNAIVPLQDDEELTVTPVTPLGPGDIVLLGYNTAGSPNDSFVIMTLKELVGGTRFIVNDNEVASDGGSSFADLNEAEALFTVKAGQTIPAGTIISLPWGGADVSTATYDWDLPAGPGLGSNNDEIYIYKAISTASLTPTAFIYGVAIGTSTSSRPAGLTTGSTFIKPTGVAARYKPVGAVYSGLPSTIRPAIGNTAANWESVAPGAPSDWSFTLGPTFTGASINSGASFSSNAQRSIITSLVVNFGSPVTLQPNAFSLENIGLLTAGSSFIPQSQIVVTPSSGSSSSYTITFDAGSVANGTIVNGIVKRAGGALAASNGNSLADGNYVLRIDSAKVDGEGFALVGDNVFGDVATDRFFRMYGDSDGDGDVDGTDAVALRNAQLSYNAAVDWDGNGSVSAGADITNFNSNRNRRRRLF